MKHKWLVAILSLVMSLVLGCAAVACNETENPDGGESHTHSYTKWEKDANQHWKVCPDDGAMDPAGKSNHDFSNGDCECGQKKPAEGHTHSYTQWEKDANQHWKVCPDDGAMDPAGKTDHDFSNGDCVCGQKKPEPGHTHSYTKWDHDANQHWKVCPDDGAIDPAGKTDHDFSNGDCECGAEKPVVEYTVTFNTMGGDDIEAVKVQEGETVSLPTPKKAHYNFVAWYRNEACTEAFEEGTKISADITLYAKWEEAFTTVGDWTIDESGVVFGWNGNGPELELPLTVGETTVKSVSAETFANAANASKITKLVLSAERYPAFSYLASGTLDALTNCKEIVYTANISGSTPVSSQTTFLTYITKVTFAENVTATAQYACANMPNLKTVVYESDEFKTIGPYAFVNSGLEVLDLPATLNQVQSTAFKGLKQLRTINYGIRNGEHMFYQSASHPFDETVGSESPDGVALVITDPKASIGQYWFGGFTHLKSVTWHKDGMGRIGFGAFSECGIQSLTIPAYFTQATLSHQVGDPLGRSSSFRMMTELETLIFEDNSQIETLPNNTFSGCSKLTSVVLPEGITALGSSVFDRCTSLKSLELPSTLKEVSASISSFDYVVLDSLTLKGDKVIPLTYTSAFKLSEEGKIYVPAALVDEYKAAENWKTYADRITATVAVAEWEIDENGVVTKWNGKGPELELPLTVSETTVKSISKDAFANSANASRVTKLVISAEKYPAFSYLASGALDALTNCKEIVYTADISGTTPISAQTTFLSYITQVTFAENVTVMAQYACANMPNLKSVVYQSDKFNTIGAYAFVNSGLEVLDLPSTLKTIQMTAFKGLKKLHTLNYGVTYGSFIWAQAASHPFDDTVGSESPDGVELVITDPKASIGQYWFSNFTHLTSITWHKEGMGKIGSHAFDSCGVKSLTIPAYFTDSTLNTAGGDPAGNGSSFNGMKELETLTFDEGSQIKNIPDSTFAYCSKLSKVVLPEGVVSMTSGVFTRCEALRAIELPSTLQKVVSFGSFDSVVLDSLTLKGDKVIPLSASNVLKFTEEGRIYVPEELVESYKTADNWKSFATRIFAIPSTDPGRTVHIFYYIDGESGVVSTQDYSAGTEIGEAQLYTPAEREGFVFYGWYTDAKYSRKVQLPLSLVEDTNLYGIFREEIALDERTYFLVGNGQGTIASSNWALGSKAPASCTFTRVEGTNTYKLDNFELMVGDEMKLGFADTWGTTQNDSNYAFGAYFFSKLSGGVFESSTAWDDNAKVANGKSGKYNIILTTKGANTNTTTKAEEQIVSFTFELVESYEVTTEDLGWYLTGEMNNWAATGPTNWQLIETSAGSGIWEGTFTFNKTYSMKAIHVIETTNKGKVSYAVSWSNEGNHSTPQGTYKMSYNARTDKLTHSAASAAAAPAGSPVFELMYPESLAKAAYAVNFGKLDF